jgi:hypothetical protein
MEKYEVFPSVGDKTIFVKSESPTAMGWGECVTFNQGHDAHFVDTVEEAESIAQSQQAAYDKTAYVSACSQYGN